MTERGLPGVDSAPACPFVAFEDDRDTRSTSPDHRHRCYAEPLPAPRAAAHQEAYCLSSAFPVCPTFQDWARREAAHARGEGERPAPAPTAIARSGTESSPTELDPDDDAPEPVDDRARVPITIEEPPIRRNPPRDWAAPPPWASGGVGGAGAAAARRSAETRSGVVGPGPSEFLVGGADASRGLAGSAADRLAAGAGALGPSATSSSRVSAAIAPDEELADLVSPARVVDRPVHGYEPPPRPANRPRVSSTRSPQRDVITGPAWEHSRRSEAYPTIRTRVGLPPLPRILVLAVALAIAAVGLFFLPALLGVGGGGGGESGSPSPSASRPVASSSPVITIPPAPTPQTYVVKSGDTMSKIAPRFGLTLAELCEANKDVIEDCDTIHIGDEIIIPTRPPDVINDASAAPSPSPS